MSITVDFILSIIISAHSARTILPLLEPSGQIEFYLWFFYLESNQFALAAIQKEAKRK